MYKRFFASKMKELVDECTQVKISNEERRKKLSKKQIEFQQRFDDTRSDIEEIRKSIQKTMR